MSSQYEDLNGYDNNGYIFNPNDFASTNSGITTEMLRSIANGLDPRYTNTEGDTMQGDLTLNSLVVSNGINFANETPYALQSFAFTTAHKDSIDLSSSKTQNISIDASGNTVLSKSLVFSELGTLVFPDGSIQTTAPNNSIIDAKVTDITYNSGILKTTIANTCHINNLTCGNINTSHLLGTTSNIQGQLNTLSNSSSAGLQTQITTNATNIQALQETINGEELSSIQNQIYTITDNKPLFNNTPITISNSNADIDIEGYGQTTYSDMKFYNAITLQPISTHRSYYIGSLGDDSSGPLAQFCIGTNAGGVPDPNIIMSLSSTVAYFFGVANPLVPVGTIQMFGGSSAPTGYLLCQGQLISKTTYAMLWNVIGNNFLQGRTANTNNFYLPDLRQMYIKGAGTNTTNDFNVAIASTTLGQYQKMSVQQHSHTYVDRGAAARTVSTWGGSGSATVADDNDETHDTSYTLKTKDDEGLVLNISDNETRPSTVSLNYMIKF